MPATLISPLLAVTGRGLRRAFPVRAEGKAEPSKSLDRWSLKAPVFEVVVLCLSQIYRWRCEGLSVLTGPFCGVLVLVCCNDRGDRIRTCDHLYPIQVR